MCVEKMTEPDLGACNREPIHIPGAIQPHGVLLGLNPDTLSVVQVAGDTSGFFNASALSLLGQSFESLTGSSATAKIREAPRGDALFAPLMFEIDANGGSPAMDATAHCSDGLIIVELELHPAAQCDPIGLVQRMISRVAATQAIEDCEKAIVDAVREAMNFDRVLLHRFNPDETGTVVAEAKADGLDAFLGLRYPASDIPRQARKLYLMNWTRLIPDATYAPSRLHPVLNPQTGRPLDLSHSVLRSVSPVHLRYMANMGVAASMSMSVIIKGKLWGLVICHHHTPLFLDRRRRVACEIFAQMASLCLQTRIENDSVERRLRSDAIHHHLIASMAQGDYARSLVASRSDLLTLVSAEGCAVCVDGMVSTLGRTPSPDQMASLISWLARQAIEGVFATDSLSAHFAPAERYAEMASGLLALDLSSQAKIYVIWFRPELIRSIRWVGNPAKPVGDCEGSGALTPRASFAAWEEKVRLKSEPWTEDEVEQARALRRSVLEIVFRSLGQAARERREGETRMRALMAEFDRHSKNALAMIEAMARFTGHSALSLEEFNDSFQDRLIAMARLRALIARNSWIGAPLDTLFDDEIAIYRQYAPDCCEMRGPPTLLNPQAALPIGMAIHELAANAGRYGSLSTDEGRLSIDWDRVRDRGEDWLVINWRESNGPRVPRLQPVGYGRAFISRIAMELGGEADFRFVRPGVTCRLRIPSAYVVAAPISRVPSPLTSA